MTHDTTTTVHGHPVQTPGPSGPVAGAATARSPFSAGRAHPRCLRGVVGSTTTTAPKSTTPGAGSSPPRTIPGTSGTIAAINGTSLEVQNPTTGQTTVTYTANTTFRQTTTTTASAVTVGSCVSAFGKPTSASSSSHAVR